MSEETIIGPGPDCRYCGKDYGLHDSDCPITLVSAQRVFIQTSVPPIIVMKVALAHAITVGACDESIACLKSAIIHQQDTEAIANELTEGKNDQAS